MSRTAALIAVVIVLLVVPLLFVQCARRESRVRPAPSAPRPSAIPEPPAVTRVATATELERVTKPAPTFGAFRECPADGDGGDREANRLKNRADSAAFVTVPFDVLLALRWPEDIERRDRDNWRRGDAATVARYEGAPVQIEGYVADARGSGPESVNCHGAERAYRDWHVWIVAQPGGTADRARSIVVEPTPQILGRHPGWTLTKLRAAGRAGAPVRVGGWLFLDPEHPDQIGRTRGTIWEIHPVVAFEVRDGARWVPLDAYEPPAAVPRRRRATTATTRD